MVDDAPRYSPGSEEEGRFRRSLVESVSETGRRLDELVAAETAGGRLPLPSPPPAARCKELAERLDRLFTFEEQTGRLELVVEAFPGRAQAVEQLRTEHAALRKESAALADLAAAAERGDAAWSDVEAALRRLVAALARHENDEDRIIRR